MDDFDDLLASLNQPSTSVGANATSFKTQPKQDSWGSSRGAMKNDDDLLGDYFPSSTGAAAAKPPTPSLPATTFTKTKSSNIDDVLKIFDDDDDEFSKTKQFSSQHVPKQSTGFTNGSRGTNNNNNNNNTGFFEEFDFDAKPTFGGSNTGGYTPSAASNFGGDSNMKDKRSQLFGLPSGAPSAKTSWENKPQQHGDAYSMNSSKDLFREKDETFDDFPKSRQQQSQQQFGGFSSSNNNNVPPMKSKSILDDSDDFFAIDNGQSRRGRGLQRKSSSQIGKEDNRSNSPLGGGMSSTKRSMFDENPSFSKTANALDDPDEFGGYNPTLSRLPSRKSQKPPRLMRMHDDSSDNREPAAPNGRGFGGGNSGRDFGFGGQNEFDYSGPNNNNNAPAVGLMLRTDKSSVLDSMDRPSEIMKKGNQQFGMNSSSNGGGGLFSIKQEQNEGNSTGLFSPMKTQTPLYQQSQFGSRGDSDLFKPAAGGGGGDMYNKDTVNDFYRPNGGNAAGAGIGGGFGFKETVDLTNVMKQQAQLRAQIEEEMAGQMAQLRKNYEGQMEMMRSNFEDAVKHERRMRESAIEDMAKSIKSEKDRMRVLHESELKSKDDAFEYEKQQLKRAFESEAEMLKRQIDSQTQMVYLAEEFRVNSEKLASLQTRVESAPVHSISDAELRAREERVAQRERRCQVDLEVIDAERERNQKVKEDLATRENTMRVEIDAEKSLLKREYARLVELQDTISSSEVEKKRNAALSKAELENQMQALEKERLSLKEEYESKYGDFELQVTLFMKTKALEEDQIAKLEAMHRQKIKETEEIRQRNADIEASLIKRIKATELRELELQRREMECKKIAGVSEFERSQFSDEQRKLQELHRQMQQDEEHVLEFKRTFQQEKDKLNRTAAELAVRERKVQQDIRNIETEKQDMATMQRTLESLKHNTIKDMDTKRITFTNAQSIQAVASAVGLSDEIGGGSFARKENIKPNNNANVTGRHTRSASLYTQTQVSHAPAKTGVAMQVPAMLPKKPNLLNNNTSREGFNLNNFLSELKAIDNHNNFNQAYISKERENLFVKNQFAYSGGAPENSHGQRSGSYTQSHFYDSSPYLQKPSRSSIDTNPSHY